MTWPVVWLQMTVKYFWPFLYLTSSMAMALRPASRSMRPSASVATRTQALLTARHETP
jgi:hypothetical protein